MTSLSINRAWDETRAFIHTDRRLIVPVVLAFMILPTVLYRLAAPQAEDVQAMLAGNGPPAWVGLLGYVIAFVSFIGTFTLILLALGRREALGSLIARSAKRALVMLGALILLGLMLAPIGIIVMVPLIGSAQGMPTQIPPGAMTAIGVLMLLFLILLFRLFLLFPAAAAEDGGPWGILKRGWALGRGNGFKLVATFGALFLGAMILSYAINQVGGTVASVALDGDRGLTVGSLLVGLLASAASAAVQVVQAGMLASLYRQATA